MSEKYRGYRENDTFWDDYHKQNGMMTNREFFTSNEKGGFYEGMEWDEDSSEWVPNAETQRKEHDQELRLETQYGRCDECGEIKNKCYCW
jgi:hypothetical protein